jgi:hypothetical protein
LLYNSLHFLFQLLSEISELEERSNADILEDKNKNITSRKGVTSPHCNTPPGSSLSTSHKSASDCDRLHLEKLLRFEFDSCPIVLQLPIFPFSKSRLRVSTFSSGKSGT